MGKGLRLSVLLAGVTLAAIPIMAARADAHALLISSDPPAGATLPRPPGQVVITFSERPDPNLSTIKVLDASGQTRAGGHPVAVAGQAATMRIAVPNLANGVYTVTWQTVSKVDGHLAGGAFAFGVGVSPAGATLPKASVPGTPRPSGLAVASRWGYLVGLIGLVGLAFTEIMLAPGEAAWPRLRAGLVAAWLLAVAGAAGFTQAQRDSAHVPLNHLLASSLGHGLRVRAAPILVAGVPLAVLLLSHRRSRRAGVTLVGIAALGAMLADVTVSHAAAIHGWEWFRVGTQWAHIAGVGIWFGGLAGLLLVLPTVEPHQRKPLARKFSLVAGIALLAVLSTGTLRAVDEVGSWHGLFSTGFGQLVIVKIVLLGALALLGGANRYRHVGSADRPRGLRQVGSAELAVVAVVLAATAVLQNLSPPRVAGLARVPKLGPIVVDAHDFATTVRLHLVVAPGTAGFNQFRLQVLDYDTGQAVRAEKVTLTFHYPDRTDVGDSTLTLTPAPDGSYTGQGANLALQGHYQLTALIQQAAQATDVPLDLITQSPFLPSDTQHNPGLPTVYTIRLTGGRQLQMYLDPGHPGFNEFHATFLGADGNESPMSAFAVSQAREPNGSATLLTTRKLDNIGHYVADAPSPPGRYRFTVAATAADGTAVGADIDLPVK